MITTNTGAKKLESSDNWREIFPDNQGAQGAHNASVGAHDTAISQMCQTVSGTTNNCGHTINAGEYFIANGGKYKATASIPVNEAWSGSAQAVSDNDLINALNSNIPKLATYIKSVTFSNGIGNVSISGVTTSSRILVTRKIAGASSLFIGARVETAGSVQLSAYNAENNGSNFSGKVDVYILVDNT